MVLKVRKNRSPAPIAPCALTECMGIIGGAWAPNVVWQLRAGPRRFNELKVDIPSISPKVLATRLRELAGRGVLVRHVRSTSPPTVEYELTALGTELIPALDALVTVGRRLKMQAAAQPQDDAHLEFRDDDGHAYGTRPEDGFSV